MKKLQFRKVKTWTSFAMVCLLLVFSFTTVLPDTAAAKLSLKLNFPMVSGMQEISRDVFVSTGEYLKVTMGLIVSGEEAVIIDTGLSYEGYTPNEAIRVKQYLENHNLRLKYILLTHRHVDHVGNLAMFENEGVVTYDPLTVHDGQLLSFGDKTFRFVKTDGHYNDEHMSIEIVEKNILFAGDVVTTNLPTAVAFQGNFEGLVPSLKMLRTRNYSIIVPGHGDIINSHEAINMNLEYLNNVEKYVTKIIERGGTLEEVLNIKLEDCIRNTELMDPVDTQTVHQWNLETAYYEFLNGK